MDPTLEHLNFIWSAAGDYGLKLLVAVIIWFIGTTIAKIAGDSVRRILSYQEGLDPSIANFAARATRWIGLMVVLVLVLNVFGINSTSIAAMIGAMTLAIGLALRDTLSNVAAGLMILIMRPFQTGHYVEIGDITGTVKMINLFNTEIASRDNIQILVPNQQVWKSAIKNYSSYSRRRLEMVIGIDYGANADRAVEIVRNAIESNPRSILQPEPFVRVTALGDSAVDLTLRVWCLSGDVNELKFDLTKMIKERFDRAGIAIPYPHMEIIHREAPDTSADPMTSDRASQHH
ncbi:MAG: small conductance mechanosensitive channel [Hyphomicrobiaceae bacterium]|jgi:small conductance mechanosensitive channel